MLTRFIFALTPLGAIAALVTMTTARAQAAVLYQVDDGRPDSAFSLQYPGCTTVADQTPIVDLMWLNKFEIQKDERTQKDANVIDQVSVVWGGKVLPEAKLCREEGRATAGLTAGQAAKVMIYEKDENGLLKLVRSHETSVQDPGTNRFLEIAIPRTQIKGREFYVAALLPGQAQGQFPAALDTKDALGDSHSQGRSFYFANIFPFQNGVPVPPGNRDYSTLNLRAPGTGYLAGAVQGNFLLRASATSIPEPTTVIGLFAVGAASLMMVRRRVKR
jgi:PEP-CTERM motif